MFLKKLDKLMDLQRQKDELGWELGVYGCDFDNKKALMNIDTFLDTFAGFELQKRDCRNYPYRLVSWIGDYAILCLLTADTYIRLIREGVITDEI